MNKEQLLKALFDLDEEYARSMMFFEQDGIRKAIQLVQRLEEADKPDKLLLPKFVIKDVELAKRKVAYKMLQGYDVSPATWDWLDTDHSYHEKLVLAFDVDGVNYDVDYDYEPAPSAEPLYRVKYVAEDDFSYLKRDSCGYYMVDEATPNDDWTSELTEAQIKEANPAYLNKQFLEKVDKHNEQTRID